MREFDDRTITPRKREKIFERDNWSCMYCYAPAEVIDHILPWSYKHDDSEDNLVSSCELCNLIASDKIFKSFIAKKRYILKRRESFLARKVIPLWTKNELNELGDILSQAIESSVVVCKNDEAREHVKHNLEEVGWLVVTNERDYYVNFRNRNKKKK